MFKEHISFVLSNIAFPGHVGGTAQFWTVELYDDPLGVLHIGLIDLHATNVASYVDPVGHVGIDAHELVEAFHDNPGGQTGAVFKEHLEPDGVFTNICPVIHTGIGCVIHELDGLL